MITSALNKQETHPLSYTVSKEGVNRSATPSPDERLYRSADTQQ